MGRGLLGICIAAAALMVTGAHASSYPDRPIRLVVPFPAGSATDGFARFLAEQVAPRLGQNLVVTNKAGAQGAIGATEVARATPDGYTLLVGTNSTQAANLYLSQSLSYDPRKDFAPITQLAISPLVLVVAESSPSSDFKSFVEQARSRPGELNYGTGNTGSQIATHMLNEQAGIKAVGVNFPGSPQALTELLGGRLQYLITDVSVARPHIEAGKLRPLGVTTSVRVPSIGNVPTLAEAGLPGYNYSSSWIGLYAPAGTPQPVLEKLNKAFVDALNDEATQRFVSDRGLVPMPRTIADFEAYTKQEQADWKTMVEAAGLKK